MNSLHLRYSIARAPATRPAVLIFCIVLGFASIAAAQNGFTSTGSLATPRYEQTSTLLPNGKVLVAGGQSSSGVSLMTAELFDPASGTWSPTGSLSVGRFLHTATLLPNGKVLVVGGYNRSSDTTLRTAQLYDPASGTWSDTGSLTTPRYGQTATVLGNGKVLVAGGFNGTTYFNTAELYDPSSEKWSSTNNLSVPRYNHTATLLPNGKLLVAGGVNAGGVLATAQLYDPSTGSWSDTGGLTARYNHSATLLGTGKVLVAGGFNGSYLPTAQLYDPSTGNWSSTANLAAARALHTATLLPNGKVLVTGGAVSAGYISSAELYDPVAASWSSAGNLATARGFHLATMLPNGKVLVTAGWNGSSLSSAELYEAANGTWSSAANLVPRAEHTATLLLNGRVLVACGYAGSGSYLQSAQLYDPASGTWSSTSNLATGRAMHTATLLPNGQVLVTSGEINSNRDLTRSAELYDPASGSWSSTGSLALQRERHTATVLPNGKVLVAGGWSGGPVKFSELYDPVSATWTRTADLATARATHTATMLPSGKLLVVGGENTLSSIPTPTAEIYDPATQTWSNTGSLATARYFHTATLLPNGKVLVFGGNDTGNVFFSAELYDPVKGTWASTASFPATSGRSSHTATLLPNGKVLVAAGYNSSFADSAAYLYDTASATWSSTGSLGNPRYHHTATLLPNGKVLVTAGIGFPNPLLASAELYDLGLGYSASSQPQITTISSTLAPGAKLSLTGSRFQGISQASSGNFQDSATNYPVVQLRRLDSEQISYLPNDAASTWSATSFTSAPVTGFPAGPALVTVFSNGIPSTASYIQVQGPPVPVITSPPSANGAVAQSFSYQITATNNSTRFGAIGLPAGLTVDTATGLISGTPATDGTFNVTITAENSGGTGSANLTITVQADPRPMITSGGNASATAGQSFSYQITATNQPTSYNATPLPAGLTINTATGLISGNPTAVGAFNITVSATNSFGTGSSTLALQVQAPPAPVIISPNSAVGVVDQRFTYQIIATNRPTSYGASNLPPGLSFDPSSGIITGTPTQAATTQVGLSASNAGGTASASLSLEIQPAPVSGAAAGPKILGATSITARTGQPFSFQVRASGVTSSATIDASGLPPGLSIDRATGVISGIPTQDGSFAVSLTLSDVGRTVTGTLELTFVSDPGFPVIVSPTSANVASGQPFSYTILAPSAAGPSDPTVYSIIGTLPPGLIFDPKTGTISGTFAGQMFTRRLDQDGDGNGNGVVRVDAGAPNIVGVIQLVATNSHGSASTQLILLTAKRVSAGNISTRMKVDTGDNVLIGGFIISGTAPKKVIVRAIGPSLTQYNVPGVLDDPSLTLFNSLGQSLRSNDNWQDSQAAEITASGKAPGDPHEAALVATLEPGAYTTIVTGNGGTTGVALVEVYDLDPAADSQMANISTRGKVLTGDDVMIGGFILSGANTANVVVRAIGPSLTQYNVPGALDDPVLDLFDSNGNHLAGNDNWRSDQEQGLLTVGKAPSDDREAALLLNAPGGAYTAIVRGKDGSTGVALVEVYVLQ